MPRSAPASGGAPLIRCARQPAGLCARPSPALSANGAGLEQGVGQVFAGGHDQRGVTAPGRVAHTAGRAGNGNRGDDLTGGVADRRGDGADALFALVHRFGPTALAHGGELRGGELGVPQPLMQPLGILPGEQNLRWPTRHSIDSIAPTGIESRRPLARSTAAMHTR